MPPCFQPRRLCLCMRPLLGNAHPLYSSRPTPTPSHMALSDIKGENKTVPSLSHAKLLFCFRRAALPNTKRTLVAVPQPLAISGSWISPVIWRTLPNHIFYLGLGSSAESDIGDLSPQRGTAYGWSRLGCWGSIQLAGLALPSRRCSRQPSGDRRFWRQRGVPPFAKRRLPPGGAARYATKSRLGNLQRPAPWLRRSRVLCWPL